MEALTSSKISKPATQKPARDEVAALDEQRSPEFSFDSEYDAIELTENNISQQGESELQILAPVPEIQDDPS